MPNSPPDTQDTNLLLGGHATIICCWRACCQACWSFPLFLHAYKFLANPLLTIYIKLIEYHLLKFIPFLFTTTTHHLYMQILFVTFFSSTRNSPATSLKVNAADEYGIATQCADSTFSTSNYYAT